MIKLKQLFLAGAMAVAMGSMAQTPANYRPAVYPQQQTTAVNVHLDFDESTHTPTHLETNSSTLSSFMLMTS